MAAQAAAQKAALANIQQQQAAAQARNLQAAALAAQNAAKMRQRAPQPPKQNMVRNPAPVRGGNSINAGLSLPNSYQLAAGQLVQVSRVVAGPAIHGLNPLTISPPAGIKKTDGRPAQHLDNAITSTELGGSRRSGSGRSVVQQGAAGSGWNEARPESQRQQQGAVCHLRDLRWLHQGPGAAAQPHAMDAQSEGTAEFPFPPIFPLLNRSLPLHADTSQDDLQQAAIELSKVSIPVLYGSGLGASLVGITWLGHQLHAGGGQQGQGCRPVSSLWKGKCPSPFMVSESSI